MSFQFPLRVVAERGELIWGNSCSCKALNHTFSNEIIGLGDPNTPRIEEAAPFNAPREIVPHPFSRIPREQVGCHVAILSNRNQLVQQPTILASIPSNRCRCQIEYPSHLM